MVAVRTVVGGCWGEGDIFRRKLWGEGVRPALSAEGTQRGPSPGGLAWAPIGFSPPVAHSLASVHP